MPTSTPPPAAPAAPTAEAASVRTRTRPHPGKNAGRRRPWLKPLVMRLHFYAGVFVAPFILVAALTGAAYSLTPQLEKVVYAHELNGSGTASTPMASLESQLEAAQRFTNNAVVSAVRPAPDATHSTRVMYPDPEDADGGRRTVFIDPVNSEVLGSFNTYSTVGQTPLRHWLEGFHSSLQLGEPGRLYSEVAASWMWVVALAGLFLWVWTWGKSKRAARRDLVRPALKQPGYRRARSLHTSVGIWALVAMLFLSATGITWSKFAGANVTELRSALSWTAPVLSSSLGGSEAGGGGEHAGHAGHGGSSVPAGSNQWSDPAAFTQVLALARMSNIDGNQLEIRPPASPESAWVVTETRSQFPVKADQVAIDRANGTVVDRLDFESQNLPSKLATWGINLHMGELFGFWNQVVLFLVAVSLVVLILAGCRTWFLRRPVGLRFGDKKPGFRASAVPWWGWASFGAAGLGLGLILPVLGVTLAAFVLVDVALILMRRAREKRAEA